MPRPDTHIQEDIHRSYVNAIIASAGFQINGAIGQEYGSDLIVNKVRKMPGGKYRATGIYLTIQLKASYNARYEDEFVVYDMDSDALNKIAEWEGASPCILVLFKMPKEKSDWISVKEDGLLLRDCCFWFKIDEPTKNSSKARIRIPRSNIFNEKAVEKMFDHISSWDLL